MREHEPVEVDLQALSFVTPSVGWAVGENGTIVHTRNGGKGWASQSSGTDVTLTAVACTSVRDCWVIGEDGRVLATADGGRGWTAMGRLPDVQDDSPDVETRDLFFLNRRLGWMLANGRLYATSDGGRTWSLSNAPPASDGSAAPGIVRFADERVGWMSLGRRLARTGDGGASWSVTLDVGEGLSIAGIAVRDESQVYIVVQGECEMYEREGTTYSSTDGGRTWRDLVEPWEKDVDWETRVQARSVAGPMRRLSTVQKWGEGDYFVSDVGADGDKVQGGWLHVARRACGDTEVRAQRAAGAQPLLEWTAGFDPCRLDADEASLALARFASIRGKAASRRLLVQCGDEQKPFDVPGVHRRALERNSPTLLRLVELVDRLPGWSAGSTPLALQRSAGAAEVPRLLAGEYDSILPEAEAVRTLLAKYRGPVPLGLRATVSWAEPSDLAPVELTLPVYPRIAVHARVQGRILLDVFVDTATGEVQDVRAANKLPLLDGASIAAARTWRFRPGPLPRPLRVVLEFAVDPCAPGGAADSR